MPQFVTRFNIIGNFPARLRYGYVIPAYLNSSTTHSWPVRVDESCLKFVFRHVVDAKHSSISYSSTKNPVFKLVTVFNHLSTYLNSFANRTLLGIAARPCISSC